MSTETHTEAEGLVEPTTPGWYAYSGGRQTMIFHLRANGRWTVHFDNGTAEGCAWGYIEQALGVWDLVPIGPDLTARLTDDDVVEAAAEVMAERNGCVSAALFYSDIGAALSAAAAVIGGE